MENADEIARRAKIRHLHVLAKRQRLEEFRKGVGEARRLVRDLAYEIHGKLDQAHQAIALLASRMEAYAKELDQEETAIGLPALPPEEQTTKILKPARHRPFLD